MKCYKIFSQLGVYSLELQHGKNLQSTNLELAP